MAILVLTSTGGSPGATSLAVGLSLTWPRSVLLADCDPGAHQAVLAGFLAGQSAHGKGLLRVAEAHRDRRPLAEVIIDQTMPLADDTEHSRLFLPGFSRPGSAGLFGGVWADLFEAFDRLDEAGIDVIVDAGRLSGQGLPLPMAEQADAVGLVMRSTLRSVLSARIHLPTLQAPEPLTSGGKLGLVIVGHNNPYGDSEISRTLHVPVLLTVPWDPKSASHLSDGRPRPRSFDASPLTKGLHQSASTLADRLQRARDRVGSLS